VDETAMGRELGRRKNAVAIFRQSTIRCFSREVKHAFSYQGNGSHDLHAMAARKTVMSEPHKF
jgi:hypothetical protein